MDHTLNLKDTGLLFLLLKPRLLKCTTSAIEALHIQTSSHRMNKNHVANLNLDLS